MSCALRRVQHVEAIDRGAEHLAHRHEARAQLPAFLRDLENAALGLVDEFGGRLAFVLVRAARDLAADADQLPQQRALADDVGVGADVFGRGRVARESREVRETAGLVGQARARQALGQRDRIARLALLRKVEDRGEDQLVIAPVEVFGTQAVGDGVPGAVVEQQAAEHRLFGFERIRRHAQSRRLVTDVRARLPAEPAAGA